MKILRCEQGSDEWFRARAGVVSASQFHRILTPANLTYATGSKTYAYEILAGLYLGDSQDPHTGNEFMVRGTVMEQEAVDWYEMTRGVETQKVGFITTDTGEIGCSPDRLVDPDGGLEIKCPSGKEHIGYLLGDDVHRHRCQVQGALWVTGRKWWDLLIYSPFLPPKLTRYTPDHEWMDKWEQAVAKFLAFVRDARARLEMDGLKPVDRDAEPKEWIETQRGFTVEELLGECEL